VSAIFRACVHSFIASGTPRDVSYKAVKNDLQKIKGVKAAHSLHMWSLTMDKAALAVHLAIGW
jgi:zinc transporter 2